MNEQIKKATAEDIPQLVLLINSAYRGESSKQGWTTEADLLGGIRTDEESLKELLSKEGSVILKFTEEGKIIGCVNLQKQGNHLYLGMLTVAPNLQAKGIGKQLLKASEVYAAEQNCSTVVMTVITVRNELLQWYQRHGYSLTGEKKPFPMNDPRFGLPKQPLEFYVLRKEIAL
jgi:N-acetylglutamate synthase-like GNAT family acetyltransferase